MTCASLACARPPPGGPDRVFHASRPSRGVVSCVALGLPGHPPKGVVPRYPPRGVLPDCSRPVPGSCRGVVSPLSGGFPHICVCANVLCCLSSGSPASPNREHLSNSPHRPKCSPLSRPRGRPRPRTKSNHSPNQKPLEQSEDQIQNMPKVTPQDHPTRMCAT